MSSYRYFTCDVFTDQQFGGNPLAVFPHAQGLSEAQMQRIARELNLSETVFVFPAESADHDRRVRIFTPGREMPFAGHPTIGTAFVLSSIGELPMPDPSGSTVLGENVGPVPVLQQAEAGRIRFGQLSAAQMPTLEAGPALADLAQMLGLAVADFDERRPVQFASCGAVFLVAVLKDAAALARIRPDPNAFERILSGGPSTEIWVAAPGAGQQQWRARMFAPLAGIPEDPATGSAAAAFAGYLASHDPQADARYTWTVHQGQEMGRPSTLYLEADKAGGAVTAVRVGGTAVMVAQGEMTLAGD